MKQGFFLLLGLGFFLFSFSAGAQPAPIRVASLSTVTTDLVRAIGGNAVQVDAIVGPGIDPHEFEPSPSDIARIAKAELVFGTGKGMEGYLVKLRETMGKGKFIEVGREVPSLRLKEDGREVVDPHWWHRIANMWIAAKTVRDALCAADPAEAPFFTRNAARYEDQLSVLMKWAREEVALLPPERRKLVTSHDAFGYFAHDFGFQVYPIEGVTPADEPSSRKVAEIIKTIERERVKAVFFENTENPKVLTEITRETGAAIGGELYGDGLGEGSEGTYDGMMRHNITTIVEALR